jgi:WD40 repeat protein
MVATPSDDMTAHLWDATTRRPLGPPMKHDDRVLDVVFSPDGAKVATASHDMTARLWDAATGRTLGPPMKHDARVVALAFSPDGTKVATASWDQTARLWDAATAQPLGPAMKHYGYVNAVTFSPDGTRVATASSDKAARLWPVPISLPDDPHWVNAYVDAISAWKEDADAVIHAISAAEADEAWFEVLKSRAWVDQRRQDAERRARAWHENEALTHEALGNWFAAAFHLRWLCQLEPKNTQWRERLAKAKERVAELERQQHANSQQRLASTKEDIAPPTLPTSSQLLTKDAQAGTWSPDGKKIAFAHAKPSDNGLRILTLATNTMEELAETGKDPAWAPGEGRLIAFTDKKAGDKEEGVWIVDLRSKQTKRVATGGFACWLADGKTVCYRTSVDGKVAVQSLDVTDDKATPKTLLTGVSFYPAVSPDGQYVAGFGNSELQIWSVAKQEIVDRHPLPGWGSLLPSWSPDSQQVGFGSFAGRDSNDGLWIYDLRTHRAKKLLAGPYTLPRWSADGKRMCVDKRGSGSKELWLLDLLPSVFSDSTPATEPSDRPREVRPSLESKKTPPLMDERPAEPPQSPGEKPQQAPKAGRPSPDLRR